MDPSKLILHSAYPNFAFKTSGQKDHIVAGTYTVGASTTTTVATGVDSTKQLVMAFASEEYANLAIPYEMCPTYYKQSVDVAGVVKTVYTDIYFYVTATGDLVLKTFNYGGAVSPGTYPVVATDHIRIVWYLLDMIT